MIHVNPGTWQKLENLWHDSNCGIWMRWYECSIVSFSLNENERFKLFTKTDSHWLEPITVDNLIFNFLLILEVKEVKLEIMEGSKIL